MIREAFKLAGRELRVFPVVAGAKTPAVADWPNAATADAFYLYENWPGDVGNYGVACGPELVVIDIDAHKGGKLEDLGDLPPTFTVRTPAGGRHLYFRPPAGASYSNSVEKLAPGVDVRGAGGYVVGPGSEVGGRPYVIETDAPIAELPASLAERLRAAPQKPAEAGRVVGEVDTPAAIATARAWLLEAPPAVEGEGGDALTYRTACRVLDFGVSPDVATELLADFWNERCSPPWDWEDLARKVEHAARYRQDPIGRDHPDFGFGDIVEPSDFGPDFWDFDMSRADIDRVKPFPWLARHKLMLGTASVLVAPGGVGKSTLTLQWALAVAVGDGTWTGLDLAPDVAASGVLLVNNEDNRHVIESRIAAICKHFDIDPRRAFGRLTIRPKSGEAFKLMSRQRTSTKPQQTEAFQRLKRAIKASGKKLVILDPFVSLHDCDENSNSEMQIVMEALTSMAEELSVAIVVVHHTSKPSVASADGFAGNASAGRGASAIINAARVALTFFGMTEKDAKRYGIAETERHRYLRLDDAKANLHLITGTADWFKKISVPLESFGDTAPAFQPIQLREQKAEKADVLSELVAKLLPADGTPVFAGQIARQIMGESELYATESHNAVCKAVARVLRDMPNVSFRAVGKVDGEAKLKA